MVDKFKFVVLEGLSSSGKSTLVNMVAKRINGVAYKSPPQTFKPLCESVDALADKTVRFFFYLTGTMQASVEIAAMLKVSHVICDRFILSTICTHRALGVPVDELICEPTSLLNQPDLTFLITCDHQKRMDRLNHRGLSINDELEIDLGIEPFTLAQYRTYDPIEIDNSCDDPSIATEEIVRFIEDR